MADIKRLDGGGFWSMVQNTDLELSRATGLVICTISTRRTHLYRLYIVTKDISDTIMSVIVTSDVAQECEG